LHTEHAVLRARRGRGRSTRTASVSKPRNTLRGFQMVPVEGLVYGAACDFR
jgi:hypothetical protein